MLGFLGLQKNSRPLIFILARQIHLSIFITPLVNLYILIYADGIIITGPSSAAIDQSIHELNLDFAVKDLRPLSFFLGVEVVPYGGGLFLTQSCYIVDLLQ